MSDDKKYQLVIFLVGEHGAGKTWVANRMVNEFGLDSRLSIVDIVRDIATDPGIFGVPAHYYTEDLKDKEMSFPIQVKEAHLRRVLSWLGERIPPSLKINMRKQAVSNFALPLLKTPREVLQYIGFGVINKISVDLVPLLAYGPVIGMSGKFVYDDLRMEEQYELASTKFQFVYAVEVDNPKVTKANKSKSKVKTAQYTKEETGWEKLTPFTVIKNDGKDIKAIDKDIKAALTLINEDIEKKIAKGNFQPLPRSMHAETAEYVQSKGPLAKNIEHQLKVGEMKVGKAVFKKGNPMGEALTAPEKIKFFHNQGTIDRSGLRTK